MVDFNSENRQKVSDSSVPLLAVVRNLAAFSSSPEFFAQPARITKLAHEKQLPIINAGNKLIESSVNTLQDTKVLVVNSKDTNSWKNFALHVKDINEALRNLNNVVNESLPGQLECDAALDKLNAAICQLDGAYVSASSRHLVIQRQLSLHGFSEGAEGATEQIVEISPTLAQAGKFEAENIGHAVSTLKENVLVVDR